MAEALNWLERFREMWKQLSPVEQSRLYDVLAMVRGPDDQKGLNETPDRKHLATARIRYVLFGARMIDVDIGDINEDRQPLTADELRRFPGGHYTQHAMEAQVALVKVGVWQTPLFESELEEEDENDDDDDDDDDDDP